MREPSSFMVRWGYQPKFLFGEMPFSLAEERNSSKFVDDPTAAYMLFNPQRRKSGCVKEWCWSGNV
jgi:hypothetical protein